MQFKRKIADAIAKHLNVSSSDIQDLLTQPPSLEQGDYSLPCFTLAKMFGKKPIDLSKELSQNISLPFIKEIKGVGPYLNFFVEPLIHQKEVLQTILDTQEQFGHQNIGNQKKVLVEY